MKGEKEVVARHVLSDPDWLPALGIPLFDKLRDEHRSLLAQAAEARGEARQLRAQARHLAADYDQATAAAHAAGVSEDDWADVRSAEVQRERIRQTRARAGQFEAQVTSLRTAIVGVASRAAAFLTADGGPQSPWRQRDLLRAEQVPETRGRLRELFAEVEPVEVFMAAVHAEARGGLARVAA